MPIGSFFRRLVFAIKNTESNFLLSDAVNDNSRLMYVRDPRARVEKVAPFLTIDGDPYPAVVDGRIQWILDGYTTVGDLPVRRSGSTCRPRPRDELTNRGTFAAGPGQRQLHAQLGEGHRRRVRRHGQAVRVRRPGPGAQGLEQGVRRQPDHARRRRSPPTLAAHFRYPADLFKVQRNLLARFHVTDPNEFFSGQDFWQVPNVPDDPDSGRQAAAVLPERAAARPGRHPASSSPPRSPRTTGTTWPR